MSLYQGHGFSRTANLLVRGGFTCYGKLMFVVRTGMSVTEGTGHIGNTFRQS